MRPEEEASYRLNLARGYLAEAEEDIKRKRWRSCAASAQLSIENSAKAIIACFVPVALTHDPAPQLAKLIEGETMPGEVAAKAREIIPIVAKFGGKRSTAFSAMATLSAFAILGPLSPKRRPTRLSKEPADAWLSPRRSTSTSSDPEFSRESMSLS